MWTCQLLIFCLLSRVVLSAACCIGNNVVFKDKYLSLGCRRVCALFLTCLLFIFGTLGRVFFFSFRQCVVSRDSFVFLV